MKGDIGKKSVRQLGPGVAPTLKPALTPGGREESRRTFLLGPPNATTLRATPAAPSPHAHHSFSHTPLVKMKVTLLVVAILAFMSASALAQQDYQYDGNATIPDPDGTLTYRSTYLVVNTTERWAGFRSVRAVVSGGDSEIDTLGGFISYKTIPIAALLYWGGDKVWDATSFSSIDCTSFHPLSGLLVHPALHLGGTTCWLRMESANWSTKLDTSLPPVPFHLLLLSSITDTILLLLHLTYFAFACGRIQARTSWPRLTTKSSK